MGDSKMVSPETDAVDDHGSSIIRVKNADELRLAQMGRFLMDSSWAVVDHA